MGGKMESLRWTDAGIMGLIKSGGRNSIELIDP